MSFCDNYKKLDQFGSDIGNCAKEYEWIDILIDWGKANGLATGEAMDKVLQRQAGKEFTFSEHLKGMIHALLCGHTNWGSSIGKKLRIIDNIFHDYDRDYIKSKDGAYFEKELTKEENKCGNLNIAAQMQKLHHNIEVFEKIEADYGSLDNFVTSKSVAEVIKDISKPGGKYKLSYIGVALAAEYLRNVGINEVKPDEHLKRFFGNDRMGHGTQAPATEQEVFNICADIEKKTGKPKAIIDESIWNFCRDTEFQVCGKNPDCGKCPIRKYCKKGFLGY